MVCLHKTRFFFSTTYVADPDLRNVNHEVTNYLFISVASSCPPVAGYLVEAFGYSSATLVMAALLATWVPVMLAVWVSKAFCSFRTAKLRLAEPKNECSNENNNYASKY
ncbi:hypothetical protein MRX96_018214 [Rhipicephalus microplus]